MSTMGGLVRVIREQTMTIFLSLSATPQRLAECLKVLADYFPVVLSSRDDAEFISAVVDSRCLLWHAEKMDFYFDEQKVDIKEKMENHHGSIHTSATFMHALFFRFLASSRSFLHSLPCVYFFPFPSISILLFVCELLHSLSLTMSEAQQHDDDIFREENWRKSAHQKIVCVHSSRIVRNREEFIKISSLVAHTRERAMNVNVPKTKTYALSEGNC